MSAEEDGWAFGRDAQASDDGAHPADLPDELRAEVINVAACRRVDVVGGDVDEVE
jgi:hypothetical protein